jgi:hypothetical protein
MHLLMTLASAAALFALVALPLSEATAQGVRFTRTADQMGAGSAKLYHQTKAKPAGSWHVHVLEERKVQRRRSTDAVQPLRPDPCRRSIANCRVRNSPSDDRSAADNTWCDCKHA